MAAAKKYSVEQIVAKQRAREVAGVFTSSNVIRTYFNPSAKARYFLNDIYRWIGLRFPG
jgi:hypothetical protein